MLRTAELELKRQVERLTHGAEEARQAARFQGPPFHAWMTQVELLISGLGRRGEVFAAQVAKIREGKQLRESILLGGLQAGNISYMPSMMVDGVQGVLAAIGQAVDHGLLTAVEDRLASEIYGDVLDEAVTLVNAGHVGCGAILMRTGLESGLKRVARKAGMADAEKTKVSLVNDWLWKEAQAYPKGTHDQVAAWIAPGNAFAHNLPEKDSYSHRDIAKALQDVQGFLATLLT